MTKDLSLGDHAYPELPIHWKLISEDGVSKLQLGDDPRILSIACRALQTHEEPTELLADEHLLMVHHLQQKLSVAVRVEDVARAFGLCPSDSLHLLQSVDSLNPSSYLDSPSPGRSSSPPGGAPQEVDALFQRTLLTPTGSPPAHSSPPEPQAHSSTGEHHFIQVKTVSGKSKQLALYDTLLGSGGMGQVWAVEPSYNKGRREVFKVSLNAQSADSIQQEYNILKQINPDGAAPGVQLPPRKIVVLNSSQQPGYLTHQYDSDLMIAARLHPKSLLTPGVYKSMAQLLQGLLHIHNRHFVHKDIKPANMFYSQGRTDLGDFGIAQSREQMKALLYRGLEQGKSVKELALELFGEFTMDYVNFGETMFLEQAIQAYIEAPAPDKATHFEKIFDVMRARDYFALAISFRELLSAGSLEDPSSYEALEYRRAHVDPNVLTLIEEMADDDVTTRIEAGKRLEQLLVSLVTKEAAPDR